MITKSKQVWAVGNIVKVGFMSLRILRAVATPGDFAPDAYLMANVAGTQLYKFVPHNGLEKITCDEYNEILADDMALAARIAQAAIAKAAA